MRGKWILIIGAVILFTVIIVGIFYFLVISGAIFSFMPNPPMPEVTYGEFPFRLTYELDGETKLIEDTIICEFDGFTVEGENGKYRKWKTYLKSGNERITLLDVRQLGEKDDFNNTILELFFSYGNAEYYMGDKYRCSKAEISTYIEYMYQTVDGRIGFSAFFADKAYEKYKIKLISWEVAPPIQNSFK